jgi:hypothetical protein
MNRTLFFVLAVALAAGLSTASASTPRIVCAEPMHDFGTVDGKSPASHTFTIRNEGDADLVIKKIHAPCGCTTFRLQNKTLAPGATLELPVTLSLSGRKGPQQKSVYLETNDPAAPTLQLTMRGIVGTDLEITPPMLVLRQNPKTGAIEGEGRVTATSGRPLACVEAVAEDGKLDVTTSPLPNGNGFVVRAKAKGGLASGQHREKIRLRLEGGSTSETTWDALILKPVEFVVAPSVLRLDSRNAAPVSRTINLRSPSGLAFQVEGVETPDSRITARIESNGSAAARIVLENIMPEKPLDGKVLKIRIGGSEPKILEVPFVVAR